MRGRIESILGWATVRQYRTGDNPARWRGHLDNLITAPSKIQTEITVHGFRSTFRDWAAESTNYSNEVVEMALAHTIKNATEAAYRRGNLLEKRRNLMEDWAQFCETEKTTTIAP